MNSADKSREPLTVLEEPDEIEQTHEEVMNQEAVLSLPLDEAVLEAFLELGGLTHAESAKGPEREPMKCFECRDKTSERCSYCLLPVCQKHGGRVELWSTSRYVMVCAPCQERLRKMIQEEQSLELV